MPLATRMHGDAPPRSESLEPIVEESAAPNNGESASPNNEESAPLSSSGASALTLRDAVSSSRHTARDGGGPLAASQISLKHKRVGAYFLAIQAFTPAMINLLYASACTKVIIQLLRTEQTIPRRGNKVYEIVNLSTKSG